MKTRNSTRTYVLLSLMAFTLMSPVLAEAGRGHHHGHHHHGHHHGHHHHHHQHAGGYGYVYSQPPQVYINQPYYAQPRYYPAPVYSYPPSMFLGIDTGNASFMLRY